MIKGIKAEYDRLIEVLHLNAEREEKDLWQVCYHYWRFYRAVNDTLKEASSTKKQIEIVDHFIDFLKKSEQFKLSIEEKESLNKKEVPPMPPHIEKMRLIMRHEFEELTRKIRKLKRAKEGKKEMPSPKKSTKKWIRS